MLLLSTAVLSNFSEYLILYIHSKKNTGKYGSVIYVCQKYVTRFFTYTSIYLN